MSWSVTFIGTPEKISEALDKQSGQLTGQSKVEFDAALPHLKGLLNENRNSQKPPVVKLSAHGSGYLQEPHSYNSCAVSIEQMGGEILI